MKVRLATTGREVCLSWNISHCGEEKGKGRMTFPIISWALLLGDRMEGGKKNNLGLPKSIIRIKIGKTQQINYLPVTSQLQV